MRCVSVFGLRRLAELLHPSYTQWMPWKHAGMLDPSLHLAGKTELFSGLHYLRLNRPSLLSFRRMMKTRKKYLQEYFVVSLSLSHGSMV